MKRIKHWQDPANMLLGAWVALSPWIVGYSDLRIAMLNAVIAGLALIAAALGATLVPRAWEEWTEGLVSFWLVISPWVLGFAAMATLATAMVLSGLVGLGLALWALAVDKDWGLGTTTGDRAAH